MKKKMNMTRLISGPGFNGPAKLRELLERGRIVRCPGVWDAMSARVAEEAGFEAIYASGGQTSRAVAGVPDLGVRTPTELIMECEAIANSVSIPVIADGDTGYGGIFNVARLIRDLEKVGIAGVHLEDQQLPKQCGHMGGKRLVPMEEHAALLKAAADARRNPDFLIISRCDALSVTGFEDAVKRTKCYLESGADVGFWDGIDGMEEFKALPRAMPPGTLLMCNTVEGGKTPLASADEIEKMGYRIVIWPSCLMGASVNAMRRVLKVLMEKGTTASIVSEIADIYDILELDGWEQVEAFTARYAYETGKDV